MGLARLLEQFFRTMGWTPSGPGADGVFKCCSMFTTSPTSNLHSISATCQSSAESGDDASAGLDLRLTQYYRDDDDRVVIDGDIDRNNADGLLQVLLSTDSSCSSPSNFIASIFSSGNGDNSEIEDWTIPRDQLEDLEDAIGDAIVVRDSGNDQIGCCIIRRRRSDFDD
ncbi:uncharacterized protein LOC122388156 isoform X2 [Amphibalanus amphitrite]|uniref:uncharacterized protein LOC122388156 isoform X2 n=1 Tax=Amphibalanus amphitrite TaxID=1232801 RepID=UPI001C9063D5|nr:uncharacterized protein LOC122388156 isoform X2 [Amphibalanus amphitrite]